MAAQIEFTATLPDGTTETRTTGTMPYIAASIIVLGDGSATVYSWHKTADAAHKAARTGYTAKVAANRGGKAAVVPVVPTAIKGKLGTWEPHVKGWGDIPAEAFTDLVAAKAAPKSEALPVAVAKNLQFLIQPYPGAAEDIETARKAKAAADRRRQRAAKKAREAAAAKTNKNQVVRDGKLVWRNSGEAHNAYRRARRAALKAAAQ